MTTELICNGQVEVLEAHAKFYPGSPDRLGATLGNRISHPEAPGGLAAPQVRVVRQVRRSREVRGDPAEVR
jgi:hypothetical protein